jgi:hypothetical protein
MTTAEIGPEYLEPLWKCDPETSVNDPIGRLDSSGCSQQDALKDGVLGVLPLLPKRPNPRENVCRNLDASHRTLHVRGMEVYYF